jgi:hypothetical protein
MNRYGKVKIPKRKKTTKYQKNKNTHMNSMARMAAVHVNIVKAGLRFEAFDTHARIRRVLPT